MEKVLKGEINYDEKEACIFPAGPDGGTEEKKNQKYRDNGSDPGDRGSGDLLRNAEK